MQRSLLSSHQACGITRTLYEPENAHEKSAESARSANHTPFAPAITGSNAKNRQNRQRSPRPDPIIRDRSGSFVFGGAAHPGLPAAHLGLAISSLRRQFHCRGSTQRRQFHCRGLTQRRQFHCRDADHPHNQRPPRKIPAHIKIRQRTATSPTAATSLVPGHARRDATLAAIDKNARRTAKIGNERQPQIARRADARAAAPFVPVRCPAARRLVQ